MAYHRLSIIIILIVVFYWNTVMKIYSELIGICVPIRICRIGRYVFHDLLNTTVENTAEHINRMCADTFVALQSCNLTRANMKFIDKSILSYSLTTHGFP